MILQTLLLLAVPAFAACPAGQMAVGDDSDEGYRCVPRTAPARPGLKPSSFKTGNDKAAAESYGKQGATEAETKTEPVGAEKRELGGGLRVPRKKRPNRGDAAPVSSGCPKGWVKKGEGCAPPPKKR